MKRVNQGWTMPLWRVVLATVLVAGLIAPAQAGYREQAKRIHDRLAGVPPTNVVLQQMEDAINPALAGNANDAAVIAMNNANFYNVTLKNFAAPWTNRDQSVFVPLNDYIATVIGMIRDDVPFDQVLYEDIVYVGSAGATMIPYSQSDNDHYLDLQLNRIDLSSAANLVRQR